MRTAPCFILLSICATMGVLLTSALSDQEMEALRAPLRQRGDLADYVLFAELVFGTEAQATQMKDSLSAGRITLIQAMQRQRQGDGKSSGNSRNSGGSTVSIVKRKRPVKAAEDGGARPAGQRDKRPDLSEMMANRGDLSGGMNQDDGGDNLQSLETLHPAVAEYALSVSYPPADDSGPNPIGPIRLDDNTYVVLIVFFRYRRSFFGEEWHRLEQFCNDNFIDFGQTVRDMAMQKELLKTMIYQLFQGESTYLRLVRLETLNRDLKRVGAEKDPSTLLPKPGKKMDKVALEELIERRRAFNDALPQWVKDQHPEAMMMDEDDVIANGWTLLTPPVVAVAMDGDTVGEAAWRDAAETEEKRSVSDEQGGSNDEL